MSGLCYASVLSSGALWLCLISGGARWQCNGCTMAVLSSSTTGVQRLCSVVGLSGYALGSNWIRRQDHLRLLRLLPRSCQRLQRLPSND
ncbi:hypothetical protein ACFX2F_043922 [Malus domestica]